jgi:DNA (cytosine-5)-methyltransferase 1
VSLTVGSLFSGIGGFDLGLERAGMRTVWFCEQDPFCRRVLARHWPGVPCHPDVRALVADAERVGGGVEGLHPVAGEFTQTGDRRQASGTRGEGDAGGSGGVVPVSVPYVDVLCGGFPCQDISLAGRGAGLAGERSGLWREFARLIGELRPRYVLVENVPALTSRGLDVVLADLAACGFDAEWDHLPASAFGAPHRRDRIWLVAYPDAERRNGRTGQLGARRRGEPADGCQDTHEGRAVDDALRGRYRAPEGQLSAGRDGALDAGWWLTEPDVGRVAHGIPARVDRLRALGNALVPQIAEWIGTQIMAWEAQCLA